ncbi:MAG: hypothetical protein OEV94_07640 [Deltaproteobacteria bacterium]|nr:hypothetical protein [Deltaproteobacteria bacterium]
MVCCSHTSAWGQDLKEDEPQIYMEVVHQVGGENNTPSVVRIWRVGYKYARFELPELRNDKGKRVKPLMIADAPNAWELDEVSKTGQHRLDTSEDISVHAPLFGVEEAEEIHKLEFGREKEFFSKHRAKPEPAKVLNGVECEVWRVKLEGYTLRLFVNKKTNLPYRVEMTKGTKQQAVQYMRYEETPTLDLKRFAPPKGYKLVEAPPASG